MITIFMLLALCAFFLTLASWGWGKPALHLAVLLLCLIELLRMLPLGK
jgi:hypothetical protein